jgi:phosphoribosylanthranilate isomerase
MKSLETLHNSYFLIHTLFRALSTQTIITMFTQVKICGLTTLEDALVAAEAGADYLGFIFYPPSKRCATPEAVAQIVGELHGRLPHCPTLVGVFVNETAENILAILNQCQLDLAQLSGEEVPRLVNDRQSPLYGKAYKALRPASLAEAEADAEWFTAEAPHLRPTLLLDAYHPTLKGGTGELSDWVIGQKLATLTPGLMLAGGLTADNVARAVREVRPFGVDVASGVESAPGHKDHAAVRAFIAHAKAAGGRGE